MTRRVSHCITCQVEIPLGPRGGPSYYCDEHKLAFPGTSKLITMAEWKRLLAAFSGRCAYCGIADGPHDDPVWGHYSITLGIDHVVPKSRGGADDVSNAVPACQPCNSKKNDMLLLEWVAFREGLAPRSAFGGHARFLRAKERAA